VNLTGKVNETGDVARSFEAEVTTVTPQTGYTTYNVTILNNNNAVRDGRTCTVNIDVPITQPTRYNYIAGYFAAQAAFADVTTNLFYGGIDQTAPVTNAYGINIIFQHASVSPDWDLVALSGGGGGGGTTSTERGAMRLTTPIGLALTEGAWSLVPFDTQTLVRGDVTTDPVTGHSITIGKTGWHDFEVGIGGEFNANDTFMLMVFVNSVEYSTEYILQTGQGPNDPLAFYWHSLVNLNAGDVMDVRLKSNPGSGNFTINLNRLYYSLQEDI